MMDATRSGRDHETEGRYDFDRLERCVEYLLDEHRRLSAEHAELLVELGERQHRIAQLESRLASERALRAAAIAGVDSILARLERMKSGDFCGFADSASAPEAGALVDSVALAEASVCGAPVAESAQ